MATDDASVSDTTAADGTIPHPAFAAYAQEDVPQAAPGSPGKQGRVELAFARNGDETRLVRDFARVPFHVSGTLDHDPHPAAVTVYLQSPTGGIAQGDRLAMSVRAGTESVASVSTQSATKVQSMTRNYAAATTDFTAATGSHLEYVPEPTILHADARFAQETTLTVGEDATAIVGEVVLPGRLARGERFDFERYYNQLCVRRESTDRLLFEDATHIAPDEADPTAPGVMGEFAVYGTLYVVAPDEDTEALTDHIHERVAGSDERDGNGTITGADRAESRAVRAGASALPNGAGAVVRMLAGRAEDATARLHAAWDEARRALVDAPAPETRRQ